ncbi:MAG: S8 family serine peptidase, partial [Methanobacteriota archaeon]
MGKGENRRVGQVLAIALALAMALSGLIATIGLGTHDNSNVVLTDDLPVVGANNAPDTRLFLRNGDFDTAKGEPAVKAGYKASGIDPKQDVYYIVQFKETVTDSMRDHIRSFGAKVLDNEYVHENAYVVKMNGNTKAKVESSPLVQWVGLVEPGYKLPAKNQDWTGEHYWCVWLFKGESVIDVADKLAALGAREVKIEQDSLTNPEKRDNPFIYCYIDMSIMPQILNIQEIALVTDESPTVKYFNKQSTELLNAADAWDVDRSGLSVPLTGYTAGAGTNTYQGLGISDSGLDGTRQDFSTGPQAGVNRIVAGGGGDTDGHGTGCTGAAAGNGYNWLSVHGELLPPNELNRYDRGNPGTAPEAKIYMSATSTQDAELYHDTQYTYTTDTTVRFRVFSSSSGWNSADGTYGSESAGIDAYIWGTAWDAIPCYAAHNSGDTPQYTPGDIPGPYGVGWAMKNGLCVAASNNDAPMNGTETSGGHGIVSWSSRGPADDERIKPDIAAPGTFVYSVRSAGAPTADYVPYGPNGVYTWFGGTSCATPVVAGCAMLVRQYYNEIRGIASPSMSLMKATLINGADDVGEGVPSYAQGWGQVNVRNSLFPTAPRSWDYFEDRNSLLTASTSEYNFNIPVVNTRVPLRITLVWADPSPGAVGSAVTIRNDLDLIVTAPDGTQYHGNIFKDSWAYPNPTTGLGWGYDNNNDGYDDRNTLENVYINTPFVQKGTYSVKVDIRTWNSGPIPFALVWSGDLGTAKQTNTNNNVKMTSTGEYFHHIRSGGIITYPFSVRNQGKVTDSFTFPAPVVSSNGVAAAGWTITFNPASVSNLPAGASYGCVATIKAPATTRNDFNITLNVMSSGDNTKKDQLSLMVNVIDTAISYPEPVAKEPGNQLTTKVFYEKNTKAIYVAYISGERYWNGGADSTNVEGMSSVFVKKSLDGGTTWTAVGPNNGRASSPRALPAGTDTNSDPGYFTKPNDISVCARANGDVLTAYTAGSWWLLCSYYNHLTDTWTQNLLFTCVNTDTDVAFLDQAGISGVDVATSEGAATDVWWVLPTIIPDDLGSTPAGTEDIRYFTSTTGTAWSAIGTVTPAAVTTGYDRQHMCTVDNSNRLWLVWRCAQTGGTDGNQRVVWRTSWDATDDTPTFGTRTAIGLPTNADQDQNQPFVYVPPTGNEVWFAWYEQPPPGDATDVYDVMQVRVRYTTDGGTTWSNIFGPYGTNTLWWNNYAGENLPIGLAKTADGTMWIGYMDTYWYGGAADTYADTTWNWALFDSQPMSANANYRCAYASGYTTTNFPVKYKNITADNAGRRCHKMLARDNIAYVFGDRTTMYDNEGEISLTHPTNPQPTNWGLSNGLNQLERDVVMYKFDNLGGADTVGPRAYNGGATPNPVNISAGQTFNLYATITDVYTGNSLIHATTPAQWSLDQVTWYNMVLVEATPTQTEGVQTSAALTPATYGITGTALGKDYTFYVRGQDAANNWGAPSAFTVTFIDFPDYPIFNGLVSVTNPGTGTTLKLTWLGAEDYQSEYPITYQAYRATTPGGENFGSPIATGVTSTAVQVGTTLTWTDPGPLTPGTTYYYVVRATDSGAPPVQEINLVEKSCLAEALLWFQVQSPFAGAMNLNNDPFEVAIQTSTSVAMSAVGPYQVGQKWISGTYVAGQDMGGLWKFWIHGQVDRATANGFLFAKVYENGTVPTLKFTTTNDNEDIANFAGAYHEFYWEYTVPAGTTMAANGRFYVELWIQVTAVTGGTLYEDLDTAGTTAAGGPHDVWFTVVDSNADAELTTPNSATEFTDAYYTAASTSNDIRAGPSGNPPVGDETFVKCSFATAANPALATDITLTFEGSFTVAGTGTMYAFNSATSVWDTVGATTAFAANVEQTMTRAIASNWGDYISGGVILWGVYNSGSRGGSSVDYLRVQTTTVNPFATFTFAYDNTDTPSRVHPSLTASSVSAVWQNITVDHIGWNFVSVNISGPTTMPGALTDLRNGGLGLVQWTRAMWYNPNSLTDPWKQYYTTWNSALNDLTAVDTKMGVWLYVTVVGDGQICVGGTTYSKPVSTVITLKSGWNMVGFPSDDAGYTVAMFKGDVSGTTVQSVEQYDGGQTYLTSAMIDANLMAPDK